MSDVVFPSNFIKYCNRIHRLDVCDTIRLGTPKYFRNIEKSSIKDEHEGMSEGINPLPNLCFFSCSESRFDRKVMKKLDYDSYYEIIKPDDFTHEIFEFLKNAISKSLKNNIELSTGFYDLESGWNKITYTDAKLDYSTERNGIFSEYFTKEKKHAFQHEWRISFPFYAAEPNALLSVKQNFVDIPVTDEMRKCCKFSND